LPNSFSNSCLPSVHSYLNSLIHVQFADQSFYVPVNTSFS
jgi:hypothetical protein